MRMVRALAPALLLAGCVGGVPRDGVAGSAPAFLPERFFLGRTAGEGRLRIAFRRPEPVQVTGDGRMEPDGTLVLEQTVRRGTRDPQRRTWRIRTAAGRIAGTLSDAAGPVTGTAAGNGLVLRFAMRGGFTAEQRLLLEPDGLTARNRMVIRRLGGTVAVLDETIRRR